MRLGSASKKLIICLMLGSCLLLQACEKKISHDMKMVEARKSYQQGDHERAFRITEALAHEGNPYAQYALGYHIFYGIGTPRNRELGIAWFQQSAKNGNQKAQVALNMIQGQETAQATQQGSVDYTPTLD